MTKEAVDNSFGIAGVVLAIVGLVLSSFPGFIFSIIGLAFSIRQKRRFPNSWSKAGIIISIIALIISVISIVLMVKTLLSNPDFASQLNVPA